MDTEYGTENNTAEEKEAFPPDDTADAAAEKPVNNKHISSGRKSSLSFFTRAGLFSVKVGAAVLLGLILAVKLVFSELFELAAVLLKGALWLLKEISSPMRNRFQVNKRLQKRVQKARREGKEEYNKALVTFLKGRG